MNTNSETWQFSWDLISALISKVSLIQGCPLRELWPLSSTAALLSMYAAMSPLEENNFPFLASTISRKW